jgi:hypothetical protein
VADSAGQNLAGYRDKTHSSGERAFAKIVGTGQLSEAATESRPERCASDIPRVHKEQKIRSVDLSTSNPTLDMSSTLIPLIHYPHDLCSKPPIPETAAGSPPHTPNFWLCSAQAQAEF